MRPLKEETHTELSIEEDGEGGRRERTERGGGRRSLRREMEREREGEKRFVKRMLNTAQVACTSFQPDLVH